MAVRTDAPIQTGIPLTGVPFSRQEYERRQAAVIARFDEVGIDALAVTANSHQEYLSGYDGGGDYFAPFPLILSPGHRPTYVVRLYDEDAVRAQSCIDDIVPYRQQADAARAWADVLRTRGLERARLGLELGAWNLAPADVSALQAELPDLEIVDTTRLVAQVAAVKSEVEIDVMRRAMALTRLAIDTFNSSIEDGAVEIEVARRIDDAVARAGGETRSYTLVFGPRTALPHGGPGLYRLERDQPAFTELSGWMHGYAAGLCRSAVLGRHREAETLHALAEDALQAAIDAIRPGVTAGVVDAACRSVIEVAGRSATFRHRTGYQIGIMWTDRGNLSLEPDANDVIEANMTLHMPIILFEQGRFGVGVSETVVVTDDGAEVLSGLPREIHRA
jgi:Xaa-Pro aminopeptidase